MRGPAHAQGPSSSHTPDAASGERDLADVRRHTRCSASGPTLIARALLLVLCLVVRSRRADASPPSLRGGSTAGDREPWRVTV